MTTTTDFVPENLDEIIAKAGPRTIVFADGSTFDYVHGVRMNGAPAGVNGRVNATIVKPFKVFTPTVVVGSLFTLLVLGLFAVVALASFRAVQWHHASEVIRNSINDSGRVQVVNGGDFEKNLFVKDTSTGNLYKCDLSVVEDNGAHEALVFCSPGSPASFTINLDSNDH